MTTQQNNVPVTNQAGEVKCCAKCGDTSPLAECPDCGYPHPDPATRSQDGEAQQWRHKLWMVACHATGGGIPEIEGVDRSVNDICVQITQARNMIYQAGKDAALAGAPTLPTLSEEWVPRIGDPVKVSDSCEYSSDWERTELWVAGIAVDEHCRGINVTVTEQWPVPSRYLRGYMGHTDGFLIARTDGKRDDLEPRAQVKAA